MDWHCEKRYYRACKAIFLIKPPQAIEVLLNYSIKFLKNGMTRLHGSYNF